MVTFDKACYCLYLPSEWGPRKDYYFAIFSRFSGGEVGCPFYVYRTAENKVEPYLIEGLKGTVRQFRNGGARAIPPGWSRPSGWRMSSVGTGCHRH